MPQPHPIRKTRLYDVAVPAFVDGGRDHPVAANIHSPSDAELLDILNRALRGDPHPVSGRNGARAALDQPPALASVIRGILQSQPSPEISRPPAPEFDISDVGLQWEPAETVTSEPPQPDPVQLHASPVAENPPPTIRRRWTFGLSSIGFVLAMSIAGAGIPGWLAGPPRYVAEARMQLQGEAAAEPGLLGAIAARLSSPHLLSQVVAKLKLDRDAEFTGGKSTAMGVVFDLFAGNGAAADAPSRAQAKLRDSVLVSTDQRTGMLRLSIISSDAAKSARIANLLADVAVYDAAITQNATVSAKGAVAQDASSKAYDQATAALAAFKAEVGEDKIKAAVELQQQRKDMTTAVSAATDAVQAAQIRMTAARSVKLADVLEGSLSPDLGSPAGLEALRNRYAAAKSTLSQLSAQLGPRHPKLLAQQSTVDGLRAGIQAELQRLVASCDSALKLTLSDQKSLADKAASLDQTSPGIDMAHFAHLQDDIDTARVRYEAAQQDVGSAASSAITAPIAVAMPAVAPVQPLDDNVSEAEISGFLLGLGIAVCLVFLRAWMADALLSDEQVAKPEREPLHRDKSMMEEKRLATAPPAPVANDHPPRAAARMPAVPAMDDNLAALQESMASLRAKVENYALRRRTAVR